MPLLEELRDIASLPHTISYVLRKSAQIAGFNELPKEKRPPEYMWDNSDELDDWFDRVFKVDKSESTPDKLVVYIDEDEIEG